jgi:PAS domain S-box-containing protein
MNKEKWKILIVDNDKDTLFMAQAQLSNYMFEGKGIELFTAKSGNEAKKILLKNKDIAFIVLDVVMKPNHKGLDLVRYIREELKDQKTRIMICTQSTEEIPEQLLIREFDINDYETKTNLTPEKLISKITLGLKAYKTIDNFLKLEKNYAIESEKFKQIKNQFIETNSELEQIKDKVNENLLKLEITLESGKADNWEMNLNTGTLTYSKRWARLLGYEHGEVEETIEAISQIIHPEDFSNNVDALKNYILGNVPIYESECRLKTKSGDWMWISSRGKAIEWDEKGKPVKLVGVNYDITERKKSENDLKQSETRFRELCDLLPQTIYEANLQGKLTYSNQRAFETFGYSISDFEKGINILDNVIPQEHYKVREAMKHMLEFKSSQGQEYTCIRKNGSTFQAIIYSAPIFINEQVKGFRGSIIDITEQKLSEKALIESEQKYRLLHENAGVGIGYYTIDGIVISFNSIASNHMNGKPEDFTGKSIYDIYPKHDAEFFMSRIRKASITNKPQEYTDYIDLPSGKKWFLSVFTRIQNTKDQPIGIQIISTDISAQKKAEEELTKAKENAEENEKKYSSLFNEMINGFAYHKILLDKSGIPYNYTFLSINPAFERLTGLKSENILGKTVLDVLPQIEKYWIEIYGKVALTGESITFENYLASINKYYRVIAYSPEKEYFATIFEDITELKSTEHELIKAKEKAEESDMLKTAFLQNMSHEIRTPMNAIVGFSSRLNKNGISDEKLKNFTKIIIDSSKQLLNVVNDILTISFIDTQMEKINPEKVNLNELFSELLSIFRPQALPKKTLMSFKISENQNIDEIITDKTKLTQILTNLISNALKFTQEGSIEFGYVLVDMPTTVEKHDRASQQEIQFYVKDTGIGIEPEMQQKIFERFRQANLSINKNYGGTGLGLSISKGFVELLGGKIWVESELGKGSVFYFTIPYVDVIQDLVKETPDIQPKINPIILVVEDEEYNYMLIEEMLISMKYNCLHSKNGQESVELCKANNAIDLVLMDIKMPVMDGHTAAQIIKKIRPGLPVIAQTAYALNIEIERYRGAFDDYITKPIKENELFEKLKVHLSIS